MIRTILICNLIDLCVSRVFSHIESVTKPREFTYNVGDTFTKLTDTTVTRSSNGTQCVCVTMYGATITSIDYEWVSLLVKRKITDIHCSVDMSTGKHQMLSRFGYSPLNANNVRTQILVNDIIVFVMDDFNKILSDSL